MPTIAFTFLWYLLGHAVAPPDVAIDVVFNAGHLSPKLKAMALQEVSAIWAAYGVAIHESSSESAGTKGALTLIVEAADRPARNVAEDALGSIYFVDG